MKTHLYLISIFIAALILSACSPNDLAALDQAGYPVPQSGQAGETGAKGQIQTMIGGGIDNMPNPGDQAGDSGSAANSDDGGGAISSGGGTSKAAAGSGQTGQMPSSSASSASGEAALTKPVEWLSYVDNAYKFSIQYPDSYVILREVELQSEDVSRGLVHQVRFQDHQLAEADTAALEPMQFSVEVFRFSGQNSLEGFISALLPIPNMNIEPYTYGKLTGLRASTNRMLAPGEFYFFSGNGMVYKLTPLGQYSTEMLQSFVLLP